MPRPSTRSIFVDKPKTSPYSLHLTDDLQQRIKNVQTKLKETGGDAVFPVDQIVEDALQRAVQTADSELTHRRTGSTAASKPTSTPER